MLYNILFMFELIPDPHVSTKWRWNTLKINRTVQFVKIQILQWSKKIWTNISSKAYQNICISTIDVQIIK